MIRTLTVENFRALRKFHMSGLGRVNLLVGTNNSGKTSVLEAIHLLSTPSEWPIESTQRARGERTTDGHIDVAQLFHGRRIKALVPIRISANEGDDSNDLIATVRTHQPAAGDTRLMFSYPPGFKPAHDLHLHWTQPDGDVVASVLLIDASGGYPTTDQVLQIPEGNRSLFVTTDGIVADELLRWLGEVALTPEEDTVLRALQSIEPELERIAGIATSSVDRRGGIAVMINGQRAPLGSMGDGISRLLAVALALVRAKGGVLLVDEIDTGLHYSVLEKMWRLVFETAQRLDVQVFATTHSRDCVEALAAIAEKDRHEISIQRIERDKVDAIAFDEAEIKVAAERGLEVR